VHIVPISWQNHLVRAGETLGNIAAQYYGNSGEYWRIANCNNVQPPNYIIYAGDVLAIPALYV
jgi:nucleoid-associated protein YgaU